MIRFDFTVSDEEASKIMDCMNECRLRAFETAVTGAIEGMPVEQIDWLRRHSQWIAQIISKMHNRRV